MTRGSKRSHLAYKQIIIKKKTLHLSHRLAQQVSPLFNPPFLSTISPPSPSKVQINKHIFATQQKGEQEKNLHKSGGK